MTIKPLEVPSHVPNPLPIETVRDLLGIVRVLYALQRSKGNHGHARQLQAAGERLRRALELASRKADVGARASAWQLANDAIVTIARVQSRADDLGQVLQLATDRVSRVGRHPFSVAHRERDARRHARIKRG